VLQGRSRQTQNSEIKKKKREREKNTKGTNRTKSAKRGLIDYRASPVMQKQIIIAIAVVVVAYNIKSMTENPMQNHNNHNYDNDNVNDNDDNKINIPEVKERRNRCLARENRLRLNRPWNGK